MTPRRRRTAALLAAVLAAGALAAAPATASAAPALVGDPTALVNPFIGTGSGDAVVGPVNMFPARRGSLRHADLEPRHQLAAGLRRLLSTPIPRPIGLSVTHVSGAGCGIAGDLPILPTVGDIGGNPTATTEPFSHADESASPGSYSTTLGTGASAVGVDVAATTRTGLGAFTYPATTSANVLFKVGDSQGFVNAATVSIVGDDEVTGSIDEGKFCDMPNMSTVYFAAKFDRPFTAHGTWNGTTVTPGSSSATGQNSGAYVGFDTTTDAKVGMQVSISYVGVANAEGNLSAELHNTWNVATVAAQTRAQWRKLLSEIQIGGGTHDQQVPVLHRALPRAAGPRTLSDANGQYLGMDGQVHRPAGPGAVHELLRLGHLPRRSPLAGDGRTVADQRDDAVAGQRRRAGGWLPKWPVAGGYTGMMGGDSSDADPRRGVRVRRPRLRHRRGAGRDGQGRRPGPVDLDAERPRRGLLPGAAGPRGLPEATGTPPTTSTESGSARAGRCVARPSSTRTDDFAISQFAQDLGDHAAPTPRSSSASQNWTNIFNTELRLPAAARRHGVFPAGTRLPTGSAVSAQSGFEEGNAAQYAWLGAAGPARADHRDGRQRHGRRPPAGHVLQPGPTRAATPRTTGRATRPTCRALGVRLHRRSRTRPSRGARDCRTSSGPTRPADWPATTTSAR